MFGIREKTILPLIIVQITSCKFRKYETLLFSSLVTAVVNSKQLQSLDGDYWR